MKRPTAWLHTATATYALFGILLGAGFAMAALWLDLYLDGLPVTATSILQALTVEPLHWLIDTTPLFLGLLAGLVGTRHDRLSRLNARVSQTNEELQEREERYRSLFENANDSIFIVSREGHFVAVNQKFAESTGLPQGWMTISPNRCRPRTSGPPSRRSSRLSIQRRRLHQY